MPMRTSRRFAQTSALARWNGALDRLVADRAEQRPLDDDVLDRRAVLRHRRRLVEALERELRLVVDEVRVLLHARLALLVELLQRVHVLDGALLAREARRCSGRVLPSSVLVSMNVREQLFGQKLQRVFSSFVDVYVDVDRLIEADERRLAAAARHAQRLERGADRAGLAAVRVQVDLGVRDALLDVVDLRLERGDVLLRAALEHEHAAELGHARDLHDVLPDVLRQHEREARRAAPPSRSLPSGS